MVHRFNLFLKLALVSLAMLFTLSAHAELVDNGDGTVSSRWSENNILLISWIWDKCSWGQSGNACSGSPSAHTWQQAVDVAAFANTSRYKGYNDWRLPTMPELVLIQDQNRTNPAIDTTAFPNTSSALYWSSTSFSMLPNEAYGVDFRNGGGGSYNKSSSFNIRLRRDARLASSPGTGTLPETVAIVPQSGWWWNPAESGRGFAIETRNNNLFMAGYLYEGTGRATWYSSGGAMSTSSSYAGTMKTYGNGQILSGSYMTPRETISLGAISVIFTDATHGTLTWPGGTTPIERFNIVSGGVNAPAATFLPETGWWWSPAESGRGFAIEIQNGVLFMGGYMYDAQGNPVWYASSGQMATTSTYQGKLAQWGGGQTLGGHYQPPMVINANVGDVVLNFSSPTDGSLTLPDGRAITLTRFRF
jgi:hypothetical protein